MSPEVTNNQIGKTINYNGKECNVVSTSAAYITVKDDNGNLISVKRDSSLFDFSDIIEANEKRMANLDSKVEQYQQQKDLAKENEKSFLTQMSNARSDWGVKFVHQMDAAQKTIYKGLKDKFYEARFSAISASNRMRGALLDKFNLALDNAKYIS